MTTAPIVEAVGMTKRFGALTVIDDLSFNLGAGEALGVVGPNGAGKTTTLNLIAGDLSPTEGHVRLRGHDVTRRTADARCRLGIGRTAQVPRPFAGLTVFENVLVGASFGGRHRASRDTTGRCVDALEQAGLLAKANVTAGALNLLDRKRLELARALACAPDVLLLDELAGGLTEPEVLALVDVVKTIHAGGMSIIWIEHIVHALLRVVDRIVAMDYGRLLIEGDPHEVMASPEVRRIYLGQEVT